MIDKQCMCGGFRRAQLLEKVLEEAKVTLGAIQYAEAPPSYSDYAGLEDAIKAVEAIDGPVPVKKAPEEPDIWPPEWQTP